MKRRSRSRERDARQQRAERFGIRETKPDGRAPQKRSRRESPDGSRDDRRRPRDEDSSRRRDDERRPRRDESGGRREDERRRERSGPARREEERRPRRDESGVRREDERRPRSDESGARREDERRQERSNPARREDGRRQNGLRHEDERRQSGERRKDDTPAFPGSCTVWVGSVPEGVVDEEIFDLMLQFGTIEGMRMVAQRGFGYVRFATPTEAQAALAENGSIVVGGKRLRIDACEQMAQLGHPYKPAAGSKPPQCQTLFVGNLSADTTEDELRDFFQSHPVVSISMRKGGYKGLSFAHVRFDSPAVCEAAMTVAGNRLRQARLRLDWAVDKAGHAPPARSEMRGATPRVYVGGIKEEMEEEDVRAAFERFGEISFVRIHNDKSGAKSFAYVTFTTTEAAAAAIDANVIIKGEKVRTDFAKQDRQVEQRRPPHERITPISTEIPKGYEGMRSWQECYGRNT